MTSRWPPATIEELVATPDSYLFAFEGDRTAFAAMDRAAYARSLFLDRRISTANPQMMAVQTAMAAAALGRAAPAAAPIGWIFHIAHCGSTLLARALDDPDRSLVLREPLALRQLGVERATAPDRPGGDWAVRLHLAVALARRGYRPGAPVVVKANVPVNFAAADLLAETPGAPAIFLYFPLRPYLLAILRSDDHRQWVMNVTRQVEPALTAIVGDMAQANVAERAAALWMAQMRLYADALDRFEAAASLSAETLFDDPKAAVGAAAAHLGIAFSEAELEAIVAGPLFTTYSKGPDEAFDNERRRELQADAARRLGPELAVAKRWVESRLARCPLPEALARPLTRASSRLLED